MNRTPRRRPVSVLVIIYTAAGDVLLLRRSRPFDFWQSVTGSLAADESHAHAAARELREETGLSDAGLLAYSGVSRQFVIDPRWRHRYTPGIVENVEFEWRCRLDAPAAIQLSAQEHSEYCWCPIDDAIERVWSWTNRAALQQLRVEHIA
jgi:dATP pyrophosphohydrolase